MEGGKEIQNQIIITTCKLLDDFQEPGVAGSENRVQENRIMFFISLLHSKLIRKIQQRRFSCLSWLERQLCRWDPAFLLYTWRQREPLGLPGTLAASLKSVAWQLPFYVHSFVVAPL